MRTLGAAILGIFLGLVTGLVFFNEIVGRLLVTHGGEVGPAAAVVIGSGRRYSPSPEASWPCLSTAGCVSGTRQ